jgi:hypothetical protein
MFGVGYLVMRLFAIVLLCALPLFGCATSLPGPNPTVVEKELVRSALNELCAAIYAIQNENEDALRFNNFGSDEGWTAAIQINLTTSIEGTLSPAATLAGPILPGLLVPKGGGVGSYSASLGGSLFDQTAQTNRGNYHYVTVDALLIDDRICPSNERPFYARGLYINQGKYLAGTLGIRDWLENAVHAQEFESVISPRPVIVAGPTLPEPGPTVRPLVPVVVKFPEPKDKSVPGLTEQEKQRAPNVRTELRQKTCPDLSNQTEMSILLTKQIANQKWAPGDTFDLSLDFSNGSKGKKELTYVSTFDNKPLPQWIKLDQMVGRMFGTVPSDILTPTGDPQHHTIGITAYNLSNAQQCETFSIAIAAGPPPAKTAYGPTYGATFQFTIKANAQAGPAFVMDRVKGGSSSLFTLARTEVNFINIALTPTGVRLKQINPSNPTKALEKLDQVQTANIDGAFKRLDDQLQRLSLSHLYTFPQ